MFDGVNGASGAPQASRRFTPSWAMTVSGYSAGALTSALVSGYTATPTWLALATGLATAFGVAFAWGFLHAGREGFPAAPGHDL